MILSLHSGLLPNDPLTATLCAGCRNGFQCDSGYCTLSYYGRCDSIDDCFDHSDEENCSGKFNGVIEMFYSVSSLRHIHVHTDIHARTPRYNSYV